MKYYLFIHFMGVLLFGQPIEFQNQYDCATAAALMVGILDSGRAECRDRDGNILSITFRGAVKDTGL